MHEKGRLDMIFKNLSQVSKQEQTLNKIIHAITHREKATGDYVCSRDYDLSNMPMSVIFKLLKENGITERASEINGYRLSQNCIVNAQEIYLKKISEAIGYIKLLADTANIPPETLIEMFKSEMRH